MFIQLTSKSTGKIIGNVNLLQSVFVNSKGETCIVGWNNNGFIVVEESYEEVLRRIDIVSIVYKLPKDGVKG